MPRTIAPRRRLWQPDAALTAVVRLEEATDPKRRARVQAVPLTKPGSGQLQADLFRIAWRRLRAYRAAVGRLVGDDPPAVPAPAM